MSSYFSLPEKSTRNISEFEFIHDPNDKTAKLGVGSFATVKLAREKKSGKLFALKIVNVSPSRSSASDIHNLKVEITVHKKLEHPNIVKFHDYIQSDPFVYIVLDYAEHGNLYTYLHRKKVLSETEIFRFFYQSCLAIDHIHKNNVMHRDIKPENLLLDQDYNIKLCDFGWSTQNINDKRLTFCGTYEYMAPEIVHKTPYDYRIDIWSLGVLLFELIHREAPYKGRSLSEITRSLAVKTIRFSASIDADAKELILMILKTNPNERPSLQQIFEHKWVQAQLAKDTSIQKQASNPAPRTNGKAKAVTLTEVPETKKEASKHDSKIDDVSQSSNPARNNHRSYTINTANNAKINGGELHNQSQNPSSLTELPSSSSVASFASSTKGKESRRCKIFSHESPAKENSIHPIRSPAIGQLSSMASGNMSVRDKENKDFMSFTGLYDLRRREKKYPTEAPNNHSFATLKSATDYYPSTTTHMTSKTPILTVNRQQSDNFMNNQTRSRKKGIFENSHLSPSFKLKLTDIMNQLTTHTTRYDSTNSINSSQPAITPLGRNNVKAHTVHRTNSQQPRHVMKCSRDNPYKFSLDRSSETYREMSSSKDSIHRGNPLSSGKVNSPNELNKSKGSAHIGRSNSNLPDITVKSANELNVQYPQGPKFNKGDENVPSLTASFCGPTLAAAGNKVSESGKKENGCRGNQFSSNKNLQELDVNTFGAKIDDESPTADFSINHVGKGIVIKKKTDIGHPLVHKENQ